MSRYFQQLGLNAGLVSPLHRTAATTPLHSAPIATQTGITEEIVERDATVSPEACESISPAGVEIAASVSPRAPLEQKNPSSSRARIGANDEVGFPKLQTSAPSPKPVIPSNQSDAFSVKGQPEIPVTEPPPDAATILQHVMAWIGEPERERDTHAAKSADISVRQKDYSDPASIEKTTHVITAVQPPSASIQISPTRTRPARSSQVSSANEKKSDDQPDHEPQAVELISSPARTLNASRISPAAPLRAPVEIAPEFNVSIGSIHLTVETPPPVPPKKTAPVPPRPTSAGSGRNGPSTQARRHYFRSS